MNKDSALTIQDVLEIKQQLHDLTNTVAALKVSFWEKLWTAGFPALLGAVSGGLITVLIFYLTKRKENRVRQENLQKEKDDLLRKLYVDASNTIMLLTNAIDSISYHNIQRNYYLIAYNHKELDPAYKAASEEYYKSENNLYNQKADSFREIVSKMTSIIAEYCYIVPESKAMEHLDGFILEIYNMFEEKRLNEKLPLQDIKESLPSIIRNLQSTMNKHVQSHCRPMMQLMKRKK